MDDGGTAGSASGSWRTGELIDGRYEVLGVLGEGGMGVVHRVRHRGWGADLAVKSPRPGLFRSAGDRRLFVAEAETWVSLGSHPHVCGCHYVRVLDGIPRVFAEYVPGDNLARWIAGRRLYAGERPAVLARILDLAVQLAWGLAHAHARGLVHQDVKPANVLLDPAPDGGLTAKITDFGLARARTAAALGGAREAPADVSVLVTVGGLTPAYASPEQAAGEPVGRRSDLYSFAVSVLEMFTGGVTWMAGPAAGAALAAHPAGDAADAGPGTPPALPAEVAALLARCLRHDPRHRPVSMTAVADELAALYGHLLGRPYPRPRPVAADLRADELNNRGLSLLDLGRPAEAGDAFAAALAADPRHLAATYNDGLRQWRSGALTDAELVARLEAVRTAAGDPWPARYLLAEVHLERGDLTAARELLRTMAAASSPGDAPVEPGVADALRAARPGRLPDARCVGTRPMAWHEYKKWLRFPDGGQGPVQVPAMRIRLTADGRRALAVSRENVGVWDLRGGDCLVRLDEQDEDPASLRDARVCADLDAGGHLALCGEGHEAWLRDLAAGRELWRVAAGDGSRAPAVTDVRLSADARVAAVLVSGARDRRARAWEIRDGRTGALRLRLGGPPVPEAFQLSPDGTFALALTREDGTARLWDTATGACLREIPGHDRAVSALAISADGRWAALARSWESIGVWDLTTGRRARELTGHARLVESLAWSADGRFLFSGGNDGTLRLWEPDSGRCLRTFPVPATAGRAVLFEPGSGHALAAGEDAVRRWSLPGPYTARPRLSRPRAYTELRGLGTRVDGLLDRARRAAGPGAALELLTEARSVPGHEREPRLLAAWRELGRSAERVGLRSAWPAGEFGTGAGQYALALGGNGRIAATGGTNGTVRVWDLDSGTRLWAAETPRGRPEATGLVPAVCVGEDGARVLYGFRGDLIAYSVASGERSTVLAHPRALGPTAFDPAGRLALIAGHDATRLWDLDTGACRRKLPPHRKGPGPVCEAVWLGRELAATAGADRKVRLWDLRTGKCLRTLRGHTDWVGSVCLSPDGRHALSAGMYTDRTIRLWDTATGACLRVFGDGETAGVAGAAEGASRRTVRFSPDGRFAISAGDDAAVRIWEPATGRRPGLLEGHRDRAHTALIGPDSRYALSTGADGTLRRWELDWELAAGPQR